MQRNQKLDQQSSNIGNQSGRRCPSPRACFPCGFGCNPSTLGVRIKIGHFRPASSCTETCYADRTRKTPSQSGHFRSVISRLALAGEFRQLSDAPKPTFITYVPITTGSEDPLDSERLDFVVLSADLVYPLANLPPQTGNSAQSATGDMARLLASYCSDPLVLAQVDEAYWMQIDGTSRLGMRCRTLGQESPSCTHCTGCGGDPDHLRAQHFIERLRILPNACEAEGRWVVQQVTKPKALGNCRKSSVH